MRGVFPYGDSQAPTQKANGDGRMTRDKLLAEHELQKQLKMNAQNYQAEKDRFEIRLSKLYMGLH